MDITGVMENFFLNNEKALSIDEFDIFMHNIYDACELEDIDKIEKVFLQYHDNYIAQNCFGVFYREVKKDNEKAEVWYLKAAEQGNILAQNNLGYLCEEVKKDNEKAEYWYLKSAEQGNILAQNNLGLFYDEIKNDYEKAELWYLKAANQGNILALHNIFIFYRDNKEDYEKETYYDSLHTIFSNTEENTEKYQKALTVIQSQQNKIYSLFSQSNMTETIPITLLKIVSEYYS